MDSGLDGIRRLLGDSSDDEVETKNKTCTGLGDEQRGHGDEHEVKGDL